MTTLPQRRLHLFLVSLLCLSGVARAQSGGASVKMSGGVSEMVVLSSPAGASVSADGVRVTSSHNPDRSLSVTLSGATRDVTRVSVPVQIRSNTGYRLSAAAQAVGSSLSSLLVVGARPTGTFVATGAAEAVSVAAEFDGRGGADNSTPAGGFDRPNRSAISELLSGPRVSTGGTLQSPQNALEVVLSMTVEPQPDAHGWTVELLLSAMPAGPF